MSYVYPFQKIVKTEEFFLERNQKSLSEGFYIKIHLSDQEYKWFHKKFTGELVQLQNHLIQELDDFVKENKKSNSLF